MKPYALGIAFALSALLFIGTALADPQPLSGELVHVTRAFVASKPVGSVSSSPLEGWVDFQSGRLEFVVRTNTRCVGDFANRAGSIYCSDGREGRFHFTDPEHGPKEFAVGHLSGEMILFRQIRPPAPKRSLETPR
jgi:hypothetical protein